jgi:putative flippase GtrA
MIQLFIRYAGRFGVNSKEAERFFKFLLVGTLGFIVDFGTLTFLVEVVGLEPVMANVFSFSAAVLSNFTWNRYWTYPESRSKRKRVQLIQFAVVSTLGLMINSLILFLLEGPFNALFTLPFFSFLPEDVGYLPAKMVATVVVLFWNFFVNRYWTYGNVDYMVSSAVTGETEEMSPNDAPQMTLHQ